MKTKNLNKLILGLTFLTLLSTMSTSYAQQTQLQAKGGANGGGGDYTESLINDIRVDIQKWISKGGGAQLKFPDGITYESYVGAMSAALAPHAVIIGTVSTVEEQATNDPDLKVEVNGQPKTCKGSIWKKDGQPHILCNIERFEKTPESERYPLIHHEYAGLAGIEMNVGASSNYEISKQLTGYLEKQEVLRLALKPQTGRRTNNGCVPHQGLTCLDHQGLYDGQEFNLTQNLFISPSGNNYFLDGRQMRIGVLKSREGQTYCKLHVASDGMKPDLPQLLPKALLQNDGTVLMPVNLGPYYVSNVSWYVSSFFIENSVGDERFSVSITCGQVQQGELVESKATSLKEVLQAFKGLLVELK